MDVGIPFWAILRFFSGFRLVQMFLFNFFRELDFFKFLRTDSRRRKFILPETVTFSGGIFGACEIIQNNLQSRLFKKIETQNKTDFH